MVLLAQIKNRIMNNKNNYYNPLLGRVTFVQIYESVIDCLAQWVHNEEGRQAKNEGWDEARRYMMHVLALMCRHWVRNQEEARNIFDGVLSVAEQKPTSITNCFLFFTAWIQEMQQPQEQD